MGDRRKFAGFIARGTLLAAALALAACNSTSKPETGAETEHKLSRQTAESLQAQGMSKNSPIMVRIFKEEAVLEVWKKTTAGRYGLAATYDICKWSGKLGPKFAEGDRQAPEGFYTVRPGQMNPQSSYHLAFNIGFPNAYDRVNGRYGQHLMVHGACTSAGCYSMTDSQIEEIYAFAKAAFKGGQREFQVQAFPFRMTEQNMARYAKDPNIAFWTMLKEGYDHFEITRTPPKVDVCEKRYVFNREAEGGKTFSPAASCPPSTQPETLVAAYSNYKKSHSAFSLPFMSGKPPAPSISGIEEAALVANWSKRRARGETVPSRPPSPDQVSAETISAVLAPVLAASSRMAKQAANPPARRRMQASVTSETAAAKTKRF